MPEIVSSDKVLELLSVGRPVRDVWITGPLDLDPLVVSRWLCGEDMRGIYQPIVMHRCFLDVLDLSRRTFYERVELVECYIAASSLRQAYFYDTLLIEDCIFRDDVDATNVQSEGPVIVRHTTFTGYADFSGANLRGGATFLGVSFPGGTNLLSGLSSKASPLTISGCRFRPADIPPELDPERLGASVLLPARPTFSPHLLCGQEA
ncbi:MAG: pentapeptide repeat-containing protein [Anaerolineae bacterium]|nr:pentapeptide repeat-containing protein [Anaerolineae bacterium]